MKEGISVTIRRACGKDIARIADLLVQVCNIHHRERPDIFRPNARKYTPEQLKDILLDEESPVLAAVDCNDMLLGYAFCMFKQTEGDNILQDTRTLYIDDLCVDETQRGKGIGMALFRAAKKLAAENGCRNLTLNVWNCNPSALEFYRHCGLTPMKTMLETRIK